MGITIGRWKKSLLRVFSREKDFTAFRGEQKWSKQRHYASERHLRQNDQNHAQREINLWQLCVMTFSPTEKLRDVKLIGAAIMECLIENDPAGVMEMIESHLEAINKTKFLKDAGIPRSTMYKLLKMKNPTIKTLAKIMHAAHHSQDAYTQPDSKGAS